MPTPNREKNREVEGMGMEREKGEEREEKKYGDLTRRMVAASCHLSVHRSVSCFTCDKTQLKC